MGWEVATRLACFHDVTVLCGDVGSDRPTGSALARHFENNPPIPGLTFHYVAPSARAANLAALHEKPGLWALYYTAYKAWQREAFAVAARLHSSRPFDVAHQVTYATYREPGYLWRLPVPFFWGPIGGAAEVPLSFVGVLGSRGAVGMVCRRVANTIQSRLSRRAKCAARSARLVWVCTDAERRLVEGWGGRGELQREVGTTEIASKRKTRAWGEPLRIGWSGIHEPRKALPIALQAVARLGGRAKIELHVLGDGPETERCRAIASRLGVASKVVWHGRLPRADALKVIGDQDVFLLSSLREGTPTVVLEALSLGLPVICHDACGMAAAVTNECGIKVPLRNPATSVSGFADGLERLAKDSQLYDTLAAAALARARELSWDRKVERFSEAYLEAVRQPEGFRAHGLAPAFDRNTALAGPADLSSPPPVLR